MITLKLQILDNPNWLEATWSEKTQLPGMGVPASESQVWCQYFHATQIDLLRAKAAEYGTPLDEYEQALTDWVSTYVPPTPEPLTPEQLQAMVVQATQQRLDDFARTRNYDGILSACTYATSTVQKFQIEGQYCVDARDNTWATLYSMLEEIEQGKRSIPTGYSDIEPDLPVLTWPN